MTEGASHDASNSKQPICTLEAGSCSVTVVRYSPCAKYLASGSEDGVVRIWKQLENNNGDSWALHKKLTEHKRDVQDLAWAPDSSLLVTVGLDGAVIIWSGSSFELLKNLDAHKSHVKGVTFDPANNFFATASDDRTVKIFKYDKPSEDMEFAIEATISNPFEGSPVSTYYRRCSWSPDGNHIAAANATNGPVTTVTIINRGTWDSDISLVGHDAPCEVASFCPRIFSLDEGLIGGENQASSLITVIATAGQDKTLAIWNTSNPRPLLVASNVSEKSITDIAWSPDGSKLFACSLDGTIVVAMFEEGELGWVVPLKENVNQLTRYGGVKDNNQEVKSKEALAVDKKKGLDRLDAIMGPDSPSNSTQLETKSSSPSVKLESSSSAKFNGSKSTQKTTITKDGKKRIAPLLLTSNSNSEPTAPVAASTDTLDNSKNQIVELSKPSSRLPTGGLSSMVVRPKRQAGSDEQEPGSTDTKRARYDNQIHYIRPALPSFSFETSRIRLSVPKVRTYISKTGREGSETHVLEIRNSMSQDMEPTTVLITSQGSVIFQEFLPKYAHLAAGQGNLFWAVATEDGTLYLYSPNGRKLMPGIVLGCPLSFLESQGTYLMAVTCTGLLYVWDVSRLTAVQSSISIAPILDNELTSSEDGLVKGPSITQCGVTSQGKAIITLSNGDGFIYNEKMLTWLRISEAWWAFGSQYWGSAHIDKARALSQSSQEDNSSLSTKAGVISLIEHRTNQETMIKAGGRGKYLQRMAKNRMLKEGFENFESCTSTAHLENRVSAAIMAESGEELVLFMKMYAVRLAAEGLGNRLEELCSELLGPTVKIPKRAEPNGVSGQDATTSNDWSRYVCGIDKHELLKDVILAVGKYREIQGVVVKYARVVGILDRINAM